MAGNMKNLFTQEHTYKINFPTESPTKFAPS